MHASNDDLARLVDGEQPLASGDLLSEHMMECGDCARRLASQRGAAITVSRALNTLDHAAPSISVGDVIARSRRRHRHRLMAAAAVLLCVTTGVAAAVPNSPLRRLVARWFASPAVTAPSVAIPEAGQTQQPRNARSASGISFTPGRDAVIDFIEAPLDGTLHIRLVDSADITITGTGAATRFALTGGGISITSGGGGRFDLEIPRRVSHASVRVRGRVVFVKSGTELTTEGQTDSSGALVIQFTSHY